MFRVTCYFLNMFKTVSEAGILQLPQVFGDMVEALYLGSLLFSFW